MVFFDRVPLDPTLEGGACGALAGHPREAKNVKVKQQEKKLRPLRPLRLSGENPIRSDQGFDYERLILSRIGKSLGSLPKAVFFDLLELRIHQGKVHLFFPLLVSFFSLLIINLHRFL